ncbi:MAG: glycosyltransferase family 25 protein [Blastocatellia bacterium]|nr:glycosyltransferase family 25 protein [Blastocatellia bacterium]
MTLSEFFPYKVCINLDTRPDRWARASAEFARHSINDVIRFPAVVGAHLEPPAGWNDVAGALGCLYSHLSVVREARNRHAPSVLIFEDDVVFDEHLNDKFSSYAGQIPSDWDMILLGGSHWEEPVRLADNVFKVTSTAATHAYALKSTVYDAFIALNGEALRPVDVNNTILQRDFNCYCLMPHLAWQEEGYSDIAGRTISTWRMKESLVLCSTEMERVLERTAVVIAHLFSSPTVREGFIATCDRNLRFLIDHYARLSPDIAIAVVEQDGVILWGNDERGIMNEGFSSLTVREGSTTDDTDNTDKQGSRGAGVLGCFPSPLPSCSPAPPLLRETCVTMGQNPVNHIRVHHSSFPLTRSRAFDLGFEMLEEGKDFFIFTDSDIVAPWPDIKANLMMCLEYDFVSLFRDVVALDEEETQKVLDGNLNNMELYENRREGRALLCDGGCIITRKGFLKMGGWDETKEKVKRQKAKAESSPGSNVSSPTVKEGFQSRKVRRLLTVFESPNPAVRLHRRSPLDGRAGK